MNRVLLIRMSIFTVLATITVLWTSLTHWADAGEPSADPDATAKTGETVETVESDQDEYVLRYRFRDGEVLRYKSTQTSTLQTVIGELKESEVSQTDQTRRFSVDHVDDDGSATVSMQYEHVRMQVRSDNGEAKVFDSSMRPDEIPAAFRSTANQLKRSAPKFIARPEGVALNLETLAEQKSDASEQEAGKKDSTPPTAGFAMPMPDKPVKVGDTWKNYAVTSVRIRPTVWRKVNLLQTYKLQSVESGIATIRYSTSVTSRLSPLEKGQLIQATPNGTAKFHIADGRLLSRDLTHDKTVFNAMGPNTMVTSIGTSLERILPDGEPVTAKADASASSR